MKIIFPYPNKVLPLLNHNTICLNLNHHQWYQHIFKKLKLVLPIIIIFLGENRENISSTSSSGNVDT